MRTVELEHLRPGEVLEELKRCPIVYVPAGPVEWHNPANPLGVDAFVAHSMATEAAKQTGGIVYPTIFMGSDCPRPEWHLEKLGFQDTNQYILGMDFPKLPMKSYYYSPEIVSLVLGNTVSLLAEHGYKLIVIISAHGAATQNVLIDEMCLRYSSQTGALVMNGMKGLGKSKGSILAYEEDINTSKVGHANSSETSMMLAIAPEDVDLRQLPHDRSVGLRYEDYGIVDRCVLFGNYPGDGFVVYDPRDSTREYGDSLLRKSIDAVVVNVREAYELVLSGENQKLEGAAIS